MTSANTASLLDDEAFRPLPVVAGLAAFLAPPAGLALQFAGADVAEVGIILLGRYVPADVSPFVLHGDRIRTAHPQGWITGLAAAYRRNRPWPPRRSPPNPQSHN